MILYEKTAPEEAAYSKKRPTKASALLAISVRERGLFRPFQNWKGCLESQSEICVLCDKSHGKYAARAPFFAAFTEWHTLRKTARRGLLNAPAGKRPGCSLFSSSWAGEKAVSSHATLFSVRISRQREHKVSLVVSSSSQTAIRYVLKRLACNLKDFLHGIMGRTIQRPYFPGIRAAPHCTEDKGKLKKEQAHCLLQVVERCLIIKLLW